MVPLGALERKGSMEGEPDKRGADPKKQNQKEIGQRTVSSSSVPFSGKRGRVTAGGVWKLEENSWREYLLS